MRKSAMVLLTDFGLQDRFVASMKGVAYGIDPDLKIFDLTHQINPFALEEASEILAGTISCWPSNTIFVAVVDPGVGTGRKSIAVKLKSGHIIITPDNGTISLSVEEFGIDQAYQIDENIHRRESSSRFHTFHGRDIYAYNGARLAAGRIDLASLGKPLEAARVKLDLFPVDLAAGKITGRITKIEKPYGNISSNIQARYFEEKGWDRENTLLKCAIRNHGKTIFEAAIPFMRSFGYTKKDKELIYIDSVNKVGLAVNQGNFAKKYKIKSGTNWQISFSDCKESTGDKW